MKLQTVQCLDIVDMALVYTWQKKVISVFSTFSVQRHPVGCGYSDVRGASPVHSSCRMLLVFSFFTHQYSYTFKFNVWLSHYRYLDKENAVPAWNQLSLVLTIDHMDLFEIRLLFFIKHE